MSAIHLPEDTWAYTHRALLTGLAIALALMAGLIITFVLTLSTGRESVTPAGSVSPNPGLPAFHLERCNAGMCAR